MLLRIMPCAEPREIMQAEHRQQEREPQRIGAVEEEAFHRRQIEPEQPDPQEHHGQRAVVAALVRALKIPQRQDHQRQDEQVPGPATPMPSAVSR